MSTARSDVPPPGPQFAATKIQPPRLRAQRLQRPALEDRLFEATTSHRVVLLQAPAGFGKTSVLAGLASRLTAPGSNTALAWLSLDKDDDAPRVFTCLAAALEPFDLPWRTLPDALVAQMHQGLPAMRRAVEELVTALAHADVPHGVIVLDDVHRLQYANLAGLGDLLLERLPRQWCLVLSSRESPPLGLARLRAMGELADFGPDALRFSAEESERFAGASGLAGSPDAAAALHERTQGWPAGLRLALLAQQSRPRLGAALLSDRYVFDYLASEVLDALPPPLHDFLLRCSVLHELTASRTAAVSGDPHAYAHLDDIERRGLFATPLEAPERTLVLHDLFRDALAARLLQRLPGERGELLRRAAASESDPLRRVGYLLQAADWAAAEEALDDAAPDLFLRSGPGDVERMLQQFDPRWRERSVVLAALATTAALLRWDWDGVARLAAAAPAPPEHEEPHRARVARQRTQGLHAMALYVQDRNDRSEALIAELNAQTLEPPARRILLIADATQHFRRGQHDRVQQLYGEVLDSLADETSLFEWWQCVPAANWGTLPGMSRQVQRFVAGARQRLRQQPLALRADLLLLEAYGHLWAGRLDAAREAVQAAEDDLRWLACSGETDVTVQIFRLIEGGISGRADDVRQRLEVLSQRNADATPERRRLWQHHLAVYGVRISHLLGEPPAVLERWAAGLKEDPLRSDEHQNPRAIAVRARHAVAKGEWDRAARLFSLLEPKLANMDVHAHSVELRLRGAHAWLQTGAVGDAVAMALPALQRLHDEQTHGYALMAGPEVLQALSDALGDDDRLPPALQALLRQVVALAGRAREGSPSPQTSACGRAGAEILSAREAEVLELLAAGQSNKLIARALDISPHTVKRHVAHILDKLVLQSRAQAAAWWALRSSG